MNPPTDDVIFVVRSKVLSIDKRNSWLKMEGRHRKFWFIDGTRIKIGDYVKLYYRLLSVGNYKRALVTKIIKIVPKALISKNNAIVKYWHPEINSW